MEWNYEQWTNTTNQKRIENINNNTLQDEKYEINIMNS